MAANTPGVLESISAPSRCNANYVSRAILNRACFAWCAVPRTNRLQAGGRASSPSVRQSDKRCSFVLVVTSTEKERRSAARCLVRWTRDSSEPVCKFFRQLLLLLLDVCVTPPPVPGSGDGHARCVRDRPTARPPPSASETLFCEFVNKQLAKSSRSGSGRERERNEKIRAKSKIYLRSKHGWRILQIYRGKWLQPRLPFKDKALSFVGAGIAKYAPELPSISLSRKTF